MKTLPVLVPQAVRLLLLGLLLLSQGSEVRAQESANTFKVSDSPSRTWSTPDGKFKREGRLVEIFSDRVRLELPDGKTPVVETARLCDADLKFLDGERRRLSEAQSASGEELAPLPSAFEFKSPYSSGQYMVGASIGRFYRRFIGPGEPSDGLPPSNESMHIVTFETIDTAQITPSEWRPKTLRKFSPLKVTSFRTDIGVVQLTGFAASPNSRFFAMSFESAQGFKPDSTETVKPKENVKGLTNSWVEVYDLLARKMLSRHFLEGTKKQVVAIDDTGSVMFIFGEILVLREEVAIADQKRTVELLEEEIVRLRGQLNTIIAAGDSQEEKRLTNLIDGLRQHIDSQMKANNSATEPGAPPKPELPKTELVNAVTVYSIEKDRLVPRENQSIFSIRGIGYEFLGEGRFLRYGTDGEFSVWQLDPLRLLYVGKSERIQLSQDRSQILASLKFSKDYLIDTKSGELLGEVNGTLVSSGKLSPDGTRIARWELAKLVITDPEGEQLDEFYCPISSLGVELSWYDDRTVCLEYGSNRLYVDLTSRITMLGITDRSRSQRSLMTMQARSLANKKGSSNVFEIFQMPGAVEIADLIEQCRSNLPKDLDRGVLLKSGDKVKLTVDFKANESEKQAAVKHVTQLLEERGIIIDPTASDEFQINLEVEKTELGFRSIGGLPGARGNGETAVETKIYRTLALLRQGVVCWAVQQISGEAMPLVFRRDGESLQQAIDRQTIPVEETWSVFNLPKNILMHPNNLPAYWVELTPNGFRSLK